MDTTTEGCGQIGKKKGRVFDAGAANLTRSETPILVHVLPG
jgi:hypothetical protein